MGKKVVTREMDYVHLDDVSSDKIYAYINNGIVYKAQQISDVEHSYVFLDLSCSYIHPYKWTYINLNAAISEALAQGYTVYQFDTFKDFLNWVYAHRTFIEW